MQQPQKRSRSSRPIRAVLAIALCGVISSTALASAPPLRGPPPPKEPNWTAPNYKMKGQALLDRIMARHPELITMTIHAAVPGTKISTIPFSANPKKIGEPDGSDDTLVLERGYTLLDPRWRRLDAVPKFGVITPLRNRSGENIGALVVIFKNDPKLKNNEVDLYRRATEIRAEFAREIPDLNWMFEQATK